MPQSIKRRVSAQVGAAPHFAASLQAVYAFMVEQDAASAPARLAQLKRDLREMKTLLAWSPASGRPARFLRPNTAQGNLRLAAVQQLAQSAGLPHLREYVIGSYVVLYAHSDTEVVLLSLKHHRQLTYITLQ
ncbi:type II toxin-antitoxin system RelE/ParE family toxin [Rhodoferax sp.]|uniref:type II toxin-antitoxin system RelE/ParE family toxin n=1 Tax=Rhodoferax sp. TaxID=50421 RepID=UPI0025F43724|nr:type II toxin-antitoxin system RelE/ParE family toxin [Rhodoferax sp.]MCM2339534.1 type II toxin-antitoxin system RelE/ParE family toxin [Rhodoferax sp.]